MAEVNMAVKLDPGIRKGSRRSAQAKPRSPHWLMAEAIASTWSEEEIERARAETRERLARYAGPASTSPTRT